MKKPLLILSLSFICSFILLYLFIPLLKRLKLGQPILKYVDLHKEKSGTPTMGGLLFIIPSIVVSLFFCGKDNKVFMILAIGFAYMLVGFTDDFIKLKFKDNQGLKPYQKIVFQISIASLAGVFCIRNGITYFYIPFTGDRVNLGYYSFFIVVFIFLAITNGVNLTDGIDGLASSTSIVYLVFLSLLIYFESRYGQFGGSDGFIFVSFALIGSLLAFLFFNSNKASVFMGDTGSLSLGGFIGAISIFSFNSFFIPLLGIMFVVSCISVLLQVIYYKRTHKRIFLMAPFHHHLQMKGFSECRVCYIYSFITAVLGVLSVIRYL